MTLKLTAFAYSVANNFKKNTDAYIEAHKIEKYPSILEFLGFNYFYPGLFSGPSLEYRDYIAYVDMSRFKELNGQLPAVPMGSFLLHYLGGIAGYLIYSFIGQMDLCNVKYYIEDHPETCNVWFKLWCIWFTCSFARFKYYSTWKMVEGLGECTACGY